MSRTYIATGQVAALASAGTIAIITAPSGEDLEILGWHFGVGSLDTAEGNTFLVARATGTATGGSAVTARPLDPADSAYAGTARMRTEASALADFSAGVTLLQAGAAITAGFNGPGALPIVVPAGESITFAIEDAMTAGDMNWWVAFRARNPERP